MFVRGSVAQFVVFLLYMVGFLVFIYIYRREFHDFLQINRLVTSKLRELEADSNSKNNYEKSEKFNLKFQPLREKFPSCLFGDTSPFSRMQKIGKFWFFENYVRAEGRFQCHASITFSTHTDYLNLFQLVPLLIMWQGPISVAIYAPGDDFHFSINSIYYLRKCHKMKALVRRFATFHLFTDDKFVFPKIPTNGEREERYFSCSQNPPYHGRKINDNFRAKMKLAYPVNIARNLAVERATTHLVLSSDIDWFPSPNLINRMLTLLTEKVELLEPKNVFVLPVFEMEKYSTHIPQNKAEVLEMFMKKRIFPYKFKTCLNCHKIPYFEKWINEVEANDKLGIFETVKREGNFSHWEPFFIGSRDNPMFDQRLNWGTLDRTSQAYALCLENYNFNILDSAFMVRNPYKIFDPEIPGSQINKSASQSLIEIVKTQIDIDHGFNENCKFFD